MHRKLSTTTATALAALTLSIGAAQAGDQLAQAGTGGASPGGSAGSSAGPAGGSTGSQGGYNPVPEHKSPSASGSKTSRPKLLSKIDAMQQGLTEAQFNALDTNKDGQLDQKELAKAGGHLKQGG